MADEALANSIAILALNGRFPGARTPEALWENLCRGEESISFLSDDELRVSGIEEAVLRDPSYVRATGVLEDIELFGAELFGFSPREAAMLDPQQRLFLECAWEALEQAGYDARRMEAPVGVFASAAINSYFLTYFFSLPDFLNTPGAAAGLIGADKDFLATRTSYKLGLRGPSVNVQTACSSSLVAVHMACQSLLNGECDLTLAGGASVRVPQRVGYFYQSGGILSPDGHCRAFDATAGGTVSGSGIGVVVLKRLEDALEDGDPIRAVIRSSAVNNDGEARVGYTAPSIEGQAAVIAEALALAGVEPASVGYVEAHGSATPLGDPIEIAALNQAFGRGAPRSCGVGSLKTNIGHLDAAAGVAGLIKAVLAVEHGEIPPSLHFERPNPDIDFDAGPFFVPTALQPWPQNGGPRRAGVSAFGLGGTNAHVVLEEAPAAAPSGPGRAAELVVLSAATASALERAGENLARHLAATPDLPLADIAYTLAAGRRLFNHRRAFVCRSSDEAQALLSREEPQRLLEGVEERRQRQVSFLFPGVGDHYPGMARGLYRSEPVFRREVDRCLEILAPHSEVEFAAYFRQDSPAPSLEAQQGPNLRAMLGRATASSGSEEDEPHRVQPALFVLEVALARLWQSWGVQPDALLGYSLGEWSAACIAGVFTLEVALPLVAERSRILAALPPGAMLAVPLSPAAIAPRLGTALSLSAVNGPELVVVGGPVAAIDALAAELKNEGLLCRRLRTSHAFHTPMMDAASAQLETLMEGVPLQPPGIPLLSNVSGTWLGDEEATSPSYWVRQLLAPVRFADAMAVLWREPARVLLEVGPGQGLSSLALQLPLPSSTDPAGSATGSISDRLALPSLRAAWEEGDDQRFLLRTLGRLWLAGADVDWPGYSAAGGGPRRRCRLPTYPFERRRYWVERPVPRRQGAGEATAAAPAAAQPDDGTGTMAATTTHARPGLATPWAPARNAVETALVEIWQQLLGMERLGIHDSFFELGGHSLLASQMAARVEERLGLELPLARIFEAPTIAELAPQLTAPAAPEEPSTLNARTAAGPAPLSFAQQRLWFIEELAPGQSAYHNPLAAHLQGPLDVAALAAGLGAIVRRHQVLRTTFALEGGSPRQRVRPSGVLNLPVVDLTALASTARDTEGQRVIDHLTQQRFDLAHGPMLRTVLVSLEPQAHLFGAVMHHIVSDEWSQEIFVRELTALYEATIDRRPGQAVTSLLPPLPLQYGDYAAWERERLQGETLDKHLAFWRQQLQGAPPRLALPTDRPRPPVQSFRGASQPFSWSPALAAQLRAISQTHGATLFMTLLAGFQALLWRYSGQDDMVLATGTGTRPRVETEPLIGCFINVVLLRADLAGQPAFATLLDRVRPATLQAFAHREMPFELLVDALQLERDLSHSPLAQVMLVLLNVPRQTVRLADLVLTPMEVDRAAAQLDLVLYVRETEDRLEGHLEYASALFDRSTAERLLAHLELLLSRAAASPHAPLGDLSLLSAAEEQLVSSANHTTAPFPRDRCLHELVAARAAATPQAVAVIAAHPDGGETRWTYAELWGRSNRLAHLLQEYGVGPEVRVGLAVERGPGVVMAILGVLAAGGVYVPLDTAYPPARLAFMLNDADVALVLTQGASGQALPQGGAPQMDIDALIAAPWDEAAAELPALAVPTDPENLAYLIYTSGSTGLPKGVAVRHRGVVNNLIDLDERFGVGPGDRMLLLSSLSFDMSVYETLGALVAGATVVIPAPGRAHDPGHWLELVERHGVTVWNTAPSLCGMLIDELERRGVAGHEGAARSLRLAILGGDWVPVSLPQRLWRAAGTAPASARTAQPVELIVLGGATELSIHSTVTAVETVEAHWRSIPYGVPMRNQRGYVLDRRLQRCPVGVPGELHLGGVGVSRGYAGRPAATAVKFIPDPAPDNGDRGDRLYRTGDLARLLPGGSFELLGRIDFQVKLRGVRVELGEVEAALKRHPDLRAVVAMVRRVTPDGNGGQPQLMAFAVVDGPSNAPEPAALRAFLRDQLPDSMIPTRFVFLAQLPLTPNGKVDRTALGRMPLPEAAAPSGDEEERPRRPLEEMLAGVWCEVLGRDEVGLDANFFDLGGHSLDATRMVSQLREIFRVEVPLREIFAAPTVAALAQRLEAVMGEARALAAPPIRRQDQPADVLSFAQERLWFLDQLQPESAFYNIPALLDLDGVLQPAALERAFEAVVGRHEVLRTRFVDRGGRPAPRVWPPAPRPLPQVDLRAIPPRDRERLAWRLAQEEARRPFDLQQDEPLRTLLLRLTAHHHQLVINLHHIAADGWSLGLLVHEIGALYTACCQGWPAPLAKIPLQYADFAAWQRRWLSDEEVAQDLAYWRPQLRGLESLALPTDRPRPAAMSHRGALLTVRLPPTLTAGLRRLSRAHGTTLFMTLLAAFQLLLHRLSGQRDLAVGTPIANRNRAETERLIGFFVNTLVLRVQLAADLPFSDLLPRVREAALAAYAHQDLPFERLVEALGVQRDLARSPLFQTMFVLQNAPLGALQLEELAIRSLPIDTGTAKFDLLLSLTEVGEGLEGAFEYATDLLDPTTVQRLREQLLHLLAAVVEAPTTQLSALPWLTAAARQQLLREWNDTARAPGDELAAVHEIFAAQARRRPDAVAVAGGDRYLSYGALEAQANRLAHHLRQLGVGPDTPVAVSFRRSLVMTVGVLGVLKAGGVCVPLDPTYPAPRLAAMLGQSRAGVLVTVSGLLDALPLDALSTGAPTTVCLDRDAATIARLPATEPEVGVRQENLFYVIFTSGSTGQPKGIALPHGVMSRLIRWHLASLDRTGQPTDVLQFASLSFDVSFYELFTPWCSGGTVWLIAEATRRDLEALDRLVTARRLDEVILPGGALGVWAEATGDRPRRAPAALVSTGEQLRLTPALRATFAAPTTTALYNHYGPAETHVVTAHRLPRRVSHWPARAPVGRPIDSVRVHLLDGTLGPVPIGVAGELWAGGRQLARGYLRAALTAARFIPDPWSAAPGGRLYRTGDLGRLLPDGVIELVGRRDHQVKVRGHRVELGELEAVLARHPDVRACAVVAPEEEGGGRRLIAYAVGPATSDDLAAHLRSQLPAPMLPAAIELLEALPLLPNGKVDRRALAQRARRATAVPGALDGAQQPRSPTEEILAAIWREVLGLAEVGRHDDFFRRGGHSLSATQVTSRLRRGLGVELPVRTLFERPILADLAAAVDAAQRRARGHRPPPQVDATRRGALPLSFAQQRLWFIYQLAPWSPAYNMPSALRIEGDLEVGALRVALGAVVGRHETLRTTFTLADGQPRLRIAPPTLPPLPVIDLRQLPAPRRQAAARRLLARHAQRPFDLERDPPLRTLLLQLADGGDGAAEHVLLLVLHHIAGDAWSHGVLAQELATFYQAAAGGPDAAATLPPLPIQYADFAAWQRRWLRGETLNQQLAYWRRQLADLPPLELPTDRPHPAVRSDRGDQLTVALPRSLTAALHRLSREAGTSLFMTLTAAFMALLARRSGQQEVVIGTPIANRNDHELEGLIGFFVNSLILRGDLRGQPTGRELLARVRSLALEAYAHQDLPFDKLVEGLDPQRRLDRNPLFQVAFSLQNAPSPAIELPSLRWQAEPFPFPWVRMDLELHLWESAGSLQGCLAYSSELFDRSSVQRLSGHFHHLLAALAVDPDRRLATLALLGPAEHHQLVVEANDTRSLAPRGASLWHHFTTQVGRTPDAVALAAGGRLLTYGALDARVRVLARRLRALGVGPEMRVGIGSAPSPQLVIDQLTILAAGGVYVPLDPSYPSQRLAFLVRDAGISLLLTEEALRHHFVGCGAGLLDPDSEPDDGIDHGVGPALPPTTGSHLAYVMYTSGSTGQPKGVGISQRAIVRLVLRGHYVRWRPVDCVAQLSNPSFDAATFEIWGTLLHGARLEFLPRETVLEPRALSAALRRQRITTLFLTTALFNQVVSADPAAFGNVHNVLFGGETADPEVVRCVLAQGAPQRLLHVYGPTESTTFATAFHVRHLPASARSVVIGRPIADTSCYVLDPTARPVAIGSPGELYLGGDGLARGYLGRPALSAERFIPHPLAGEAGGRLYRSGDRVRWRTDGTLDFLGRRDHQVKIRGFRIEPGEIETLLASDETVARAVVLARDSAAGGRQLVAYLIPAAGGSIDPAALRQRLDERLPSYMVPAAFAVLDSLPLTPNGKVDRAALGRLPLPDALAAAGRPARSPEEQVLCDLFAAVLALPAGRAVGIDDSFFDLGGHSLLAARLVSWVRTTLGVEVPIRALFENPTVAALAPRLRTGEGAVLPPLVRQPRPARLPLSPAQARLWFLDRLAGPSATYNIPLALRLKEDVDIPALEAALADVVARHESLRTVVRAQDEAPWQEVLPAAALGPLLVTEVVAPAALEPCLATAAATPFALDREIPLKAWLFRLVPQPGAPPRQFLLLLLLHHIAGDGWSLGPLGRDLANAYAARRRGAAPAWDALPVQYADYTLWQRGFLGDEADAASPLARQLAFWRATLSGLPAAIPLPADRPRPATASERGASVPVVLGSAVRHDLQALARQQGASLFMVVQALLATLLWRLGSGRDIPVGTPIAGRREEGLEDLVGCFVNTLVLRTTVAPTWTFHTLLTRVREADLAAYAHQDLPFEHLVDRLGVARHLARSPLFQVMLTVQEGAVAALPEFAVEALPVAVDTAKFDLSLALIASDEALGGELEFALDLFDPTTAGRMAACFARLATAVAADGTQRLADLPTFGAAERHQLVVEWNDSHAPGDGDLATLPALFAAQQARTPDAVAVAGDGEALTYGAIVRHARRLAAHLNALGVGPETPVGLAVGRSPAMVVGVLGILEAGGAYLPLDVRHPAARTEAILRDAGVGVVVTEQGLRHQLPSASGSEAWEQVCLDALPTVPPRPVRPPRADNLCYVIFTSGSTGQPKGVMIRHGAVAALHAARRVFWPAGGPWRIALCAPLVFDAFVDPLLALCVGHPLEIVPEEAFHDGAALARLVQARRIEVFDGTPSQLATLLESAPLPDAAGRDGSTTLRWIFLGGEALPAGLWRTLAEAPRLQAINLYGPTESTVEATWARVTGPLPHLGRPLAGTRLRVLDEGLEITAMGVPGEIAIAGSGLARGYLQRPALTAERFVPDPWASTPGARLYRSGDRGRYQADGTSSFLGRIDHQVKVRGFRVELGEIESVLGRHPAVSACAVLIRGEVISGEDGAARRLVAYVVSGGTPAEALRAHLRRHLPAYMLPTVFVELEALPLQASGKIDRAALPQPAADAVEAGHQRPRTPSEEILAGIWAAVLGLEEVGVEANFFEIGGHSLLATRIMARLRRAFETELPVRALFEAPTIAALAQRLEAARHEASRPAAPPLVPWAPEHEGPPPLSFAQERLWFLQQMLPASAFYNVPTALVLRGRLDVEALRHACEAAVHRHAVLRTRFPAVDGKPVQAIDPPAPRPLPLVDLSGLPAALRNAAAQRLMQAEARRPFDLERGALLRSWLLRLDTRHYRLFLNEHHIISDAGSVDVLVREVEAFYRAGQQGIAATLPPLAIGYADFAAWQRRWLSGDVLDAQLDYWRQQLQDVPPLALPTDRPRPAVTRYQGAVHGFRLPATLASDLQSLSRQHQATLFMTVLAAFQGFLHRLTGQGDLAVGTPISHRDRPELEPLVGLFLNTLVLRARPAASQPFTELLAQVRATALAAYGHQELPFERLVEALGVERDLARTPLFQAMLVFTERGGPPLRLPGLEVESLALSTGTAKFDLSLLLAVGDDGLHGGFEYASELFDDTTLGRMAAHLALWLQGIVAQPEARLADLPLLSDAESHQLLQEWNAPPEVVGDETTALPVHEQLWRHARRAPDAVALATDDGCVLSYGRLAAKADGLARRLHALGVGPDVRVALAVGRSPAMTVGVLGILRAGGACVPLDPTYPDERLAAMLADAGVAALVTESALLPSLPASAVPVLCLDQEASRPAPGPHPAGRPVAPENLFYVIFTSGSTGRPKGIALHHGLFSRLTHWHLDALVNAAGKSRPYRGAAVLQFASLSFDVSFYEMFAAWCSGGTLYLVSEALRRDLGALARWVAARRLDEAILPASALELWAEEPAARACTTLGNLVSTGEQLRITPPLAALFARPGLTTTLHNHYGPAETHVVTAYRFAPSSAQWPSRVPVGWPVDGARILLLDGALKPVPMGAAGELYIGGVQLARGYLRAAATAERFLPDPWDMATGARLYRTGDLARRRADGVIELLGRQDQQIKIRGHRVELGEVEAVLARHPQVSSCAVVAPPERAGAPTRRLVAYVMAEETLAEHDLREHLHRQLPAYMVPAVLVQLPALPLLPNGKIDRRTLQQRALDERTVPAATYMAPRNDLEKRLAAIWSELLGRDPIGIHDNFFDLGGHSLLIVQLLSRIRDAFGQQLEVLALFEHSTVAALAALLEAYTAPPPAEAPQAPAAPHRAAARQQGIALARARRRPPRRNPSPVDVEEDVDVEENKDEP